MVISLTGLLFDLTMTSLKIYTITDSLESDHFCTKSYFNVSVSKPSTLYRTVRNIANIDRPSFIAELSSVSEFSSVENANRFCDFLCTVLDKHAPPSLQRGTLSREEMEEHKVNYFPGLVQTRFQNLCTQLSVNFTLKE